MIDLYYWPTPNGHKITIALEELGMNYNIIPVNIGANEQFKPSFLKISPNNKIPAIVDHEPAAGFGVEGLAIFESGAILEYLAVKSGRLWPKSPRDRMEALCWLYWQVGGLGPMAGQAAHFLHFAAERIEYGRKRYSEEVKRLFGVLDRRLEGRDVIVGDEFGIADIACYPWIKGHEKLGIDLGDFAEVARWLKAISERKSVKGAYARAEEISG